MHARRQPLSWKHINTFVLEQVQTSGVVLHLTIQYDHLAAFLFYKGGTSMHLGKGNARNGIIDQHSAQAGAESALQVNVSYD
eukprot:1157230-Pelagomonas_calceolata.AAC.3